MKYRNRKSVTTYHKAKIGRKKDREEERKRLTDKHVNKATDKDTQQHRQTEKWI